MGLANLCRIMPLATCVNQLQHIKKKVNNTQLSEQDIKAALTLYGLVVIGYGYVTYKLINRIDNIEIELGIKKLPETNNDEQEVN